MLFISVFIFTGCEKIIFNENKYNTPENLFEIFWNEFDRHYSFFPYLNLDWDSVYLVYQPRFRNDLNQQQVFNLLAQMTYLLKDGHVNLFSNNSVSAYNGWYDQYPLNRNNINPYLDNLKTPNNKILYANLKSHNIGYIMISSFAGEKEDFLVIDQILEELTTKKGLIIDVRSNGGGNSNNASAIASRFADKEYLVFRIRYRNGPDHNDFTDWSDIKLQPSEGESYNKQVVVLSNRRCYSSTEWFLGNMDLLPNVTIVGDTSGGGSGSPMQRQLPNGWTFRLSNTQMQLPSGRDFQFSGIYPDVPVWISQADSARGFDSILETAIGIIENTY